MVIEDIGARIREARTRLGMTQNDIAGSLQVSPQAVSKWERGENAPDIVLLPALAILLGITTDRLLGTTAPSTGTIEATVCFSDIRGFTRKASSLDPDEIASIMNAHYLQITESVVRYDGVPVKYIGDSSLFFFAGPEHRIRAIRSALSATRILSDEVSIGMASGPIYIGRLGHPDYATLDIMGDYVNLAARTQQWTGRREANVSASRETVDPVAEFLTLGEMEQVTVQGRIAETILYEVLGLNEKAS